MWTAESFIVLCAFVCPVEQWTKEQPLLRPQFLNSVPSCFHGNKLLTKEQPFLKTSWGWFVGWGQSGSNLPPSSLFCSLSCSVFVLCPALCFCSQSCSMFSVLCFCSQSCSVFFVLCFCSQSCSVFLFSVLVCVLCPVLCFCFLCCSVFFLCPVLCSLSCSVFLFSVLLCVFVLCPALCFVLCPAVCFVLCSVPPPTPYLVFSCTLFFVVLSALPCHAGHPKEIRAMRTNKSFFPFLIWNNDLMLGKRYFTPKVQAVCPVERCSFSTSCVLTFQSRCWHSLLLWYV